MTDYLNEIQKISKVLSNQMLNIIKASNCSDKTFTGRVTDVINPKKYKVFNSGHTYTVASSIECTVGEWVRVCAPQGNWNDLFVVTKC